MKQDWKDTECQVPGLLRRVMAFFYDSLLWLAILMVASFPVVAAIGGPPGSGPARWAFQLYLLAISFLFFGWFWTHGGQTPGMKTWHLRVSSDPEGNPLSWVQALKRFLAAGLTLLTVGLGLFMALGSARRLALHDRLSGTRLCLLPRPPGK